jgi:hypothetical protein
LNRYRVGLPHRPEAAIATDVTISPDLRRLVQSFASIRAGNEGGNLSFGQRVSDASIWRDKLSLFVQNFIILTSLLSRFFSTTLNPFGARYGLALFCRDVPAWPWHMHAGLRGEFLHRQLPMISRLLSLIL